MKDCNQCGKCCIKYADGALSATQDEIDDWELFNPDIFQYVKDNKIWYDPISRKRLSYCPFLELVPNAKPLSPLKYTCGIYQDRPEDCRLYPSLISEMVADECEMIEPKDLIAPAKSQRALDVLMLDSR